MTWHALNSEKTYKPEKEWARESWIKRLPHQSDSLKGQFNGYNFIISPVPCDLHHLVLDVLSQPLLQRLGDHGNLVPVNHITQPSISSSELRRHTGQREDWLQKHIPKLCINLTPWQEKLRFKNNTSCQGSETLKRNTQQQVLTESEQFITD